MHDFKTSSFVAPNGGSVPLISRLSFSFHVLENDITRLEDFQG